jgi:hypothetical protein
MASDAVWCDGTTHRAEVEVVTMVVVEQAESINRTLMVGSESTIANQLQQLKDGSAKNESIFIEYCCDKCKEAVNGSRSGS